MKRSAHDYAAALYQAVAEQPAQAGLYIKNLSYRLQLERNQQLWPLIVDQLEQIEATANKQLLVTVTTAKPLVEATQEQIKKMIFTQFPTVSDVKLKLQVNENVIGGIKLQINDKVVDNTLRAKLDRLATRL